MFRDNFFFLDGKQENIITLDFLQEGSQSGKLAGTWDCWYRGQGQLRLRGAIFSLLQAI